MSTAAHTTPVRIETQPNGDAEIIIGVTMPDGTVVTLRQALDDNRVATLLQNLAGVVNVRTQIRNRTLMSPLKGYTPPKSSDVLDKAFMPGYPLSGAAPKTEYPCPVALVPRVDTV